MEEAGAEGGVGGGEVEGGEAEGVERGGGGEGVEVAEEVGSEGVVGRGRFFGRGFPLEFAAEMATQGGEEAGEEVGQEDGGEDVSGATEEGGQAMRVGFNLYNVGVFLAERAVAEEGGQAEVEQTGERAGFGGPVVGGASAGERADDGFELRGEKRLKIGVFLLGSDDVRGGGPGVGEVSDVIRHFVRDAMGMTLAASSRVVSGCPQERLRGCLQGSFMGAFGSFSSLTALLVAEREDDVGMKSASSVDHVIQKASSTLRDTGEGNLP